MPLIVRFNLKDLNRHQWRMTFIIAPAPGLHFCVFTIGTGGAGRSIRTFPDQPGERNLLLVFLRLAGRCRGNRPFTNSYTTSTYDAGAIRSCRRHAGEVRQSLQPNPRFGRKQISVYGGTGRSVCCFPDLPRVVPAVPAHQSRDRDRTRDYRRRANCSATNLSASKITEDRLNKVSAS